jgi:NADPH-dependent 7-cyano-7-deazaguanine reductase QueF
MLLLKQDTSVPSSQFVFRNVENFEELQWEEIYQNIKRSVKERNLQAFQYMLHNILPTNQKLK